MKLLVVLKEGEPRDPRKQNENESREPEKKDYNTYNFTDFLVE